MLLQPFSGHTAVKGGRLRWTAVGPLGPYRSSPLLDDKNEQNPRQSCCTGSICLETCRTPVFGALTAVFGEYCVKMRPTQLYCGKLVNFSHGPLRYRQCVPTALFDNLFKTRLKTLIFSLYTVLIYQLACLYSIHHYKLLHNQI